MFERNKSVLVFKVSVDGKELGVYWLLCWATGMMAMRWRLDGYNSCVCGLRQHSSLLSDISLSSFSITLMHSRGLVRRFGLVVRRAALLRLQRWMFVRARYLTNCPGHFSVCMLKAPWRILRNVFLSSSSSELWNQRLNAPLHHVKPMSQLRFDYDTTITTKNWIGMFTFLLVSNLVEWKQARAIRRSRIVVVS